VQAPVTTAAVPVQVPADPVARPSVAVQVPADASARPVQAPADHAARPAQTPVRRAPAVVVEEYRYLVIIGSFKGEENAPDNG